MQAGGARPGLGHAPGHRQDAGGLRLHRRPRRRRRDPSSPTPSTTCSGRSGPGPTLDIRDRRLVTIGVLAALGQAELLEIQFQCALDRGELTEDQVREIVLHLDPLHRLATGHRLNAAAERVIARRRQGGEASEPEPGGREAWTRMITYDFTGKVAW